MKTMRALVKKTPAEGLDLETVPVPEVGINDVLIRIQKTAICGTDVHIYEWNEWAQRTIPVPMVIGHEFVGQVEKVGANVHDYKPGNLVSGEGHITCGHCRNCMAGRRHLCAHTVGVGVNRSGAFAELLSIPMTNVWYADPRIPTDVLACFDPLGNATHTALSFPVLGEDVLITGAGPIGCMAAAICRYAGARHVVVTDVNPHRLELARKMGTTLTVDVRTRKLDEVMRELDMKEGFDVGLEMSGNPAAFRDMLRAMAHGGKIALLGIQSVESAIDWDLVVFNGLTIKGIYGREMFETWYKMSMMIAGGLDIQPLITHRLSYKDYEEGFAAMRSGLSGKVVLSWESI
jgi:threonine 3-dehydrogenase